MGEQERAFDRAYELALGPINNRLHDRCYAYIAGHRLDKWGFPNSPPPPGVVSWWFETLQKAQESKMLRVFMIELRVDFRDSSKNELVRKALAQAAATLNGQVSMIQDHVKPQIAIYSDDFFHTHEEINMLAEIPDDMKVKEAEPVKAGPFPGIKVSTPVKATAAGQGQAAHAAHPVALEPGDQGGAEEGAQGAVAQLEDDALSDVVPGAAILSDDDLLGALRGMAR